MKFKWKQILNLIGGKNIKKNVFVWTIILDFFFDIYI